MLAILAQERNGLCCLRHPCGTNSQRLPNFTLLDQLRAPSLVAMGHDLHWEHHPAVVL